MIGNELKEFLDEKVIFYENPEFITSDPIQIPHRFSLKEDIEIAAFLTSIISWGHRKLIIRNATRMMELLDNAPYDYIMNHQKDDLKSLNGFVHRTFNSIDFKQFITSLRHLYMHHGGLEDALRIKDGSDTYRSTIHDFKNLFFEMAHPQRTEKHISDPLKNSAAKRINMFLRWMVRDAKCEVDFGLWKSHNAANLSCPLDVHSAATARNFSLLTRTKNDWKAVSELDKNLRLLDVKDPVKYDFALFGLGVFEQENEIKSFFKTYNANK